MPVEVIFKNEALTVRLVGLLDCVWFFLSHNGTQTSICVGNKLNCLLKTAAEVLSFATGSGIVDHWPVDHKVRSYVPLSLFPTPNTASVWRADVMLSGGKYKHVLLTSLYTSSLLSVDIPTVGSGEQTQDKPLSQRSLNWKLISVVGFHSKSKRVIQDIIVKR